MKCPCKKPGDQEEVAVVVTFKTQHSNVCHRTAMADTQVLEHSEGSGLDHENRLLLRGSHVCGLCLSTVAVERYRRESRAVAVESF